MTDAPVSTQALPGHSFQILTDQDRRRIHDLLFGLSIGEDDTHDDQPLYESILDVARAAQLSGVTVLRGIAGYGVGTPSRNLSRVLERPSDRRREEKINAWLPALRRMLRGGLVTVENVRVLQGGSVAPTQMN
jgi:PII-like signaling protein